MILLFACELCKQMSELITFGDAFPSACDVYFDRISSALHAQRLDAATEHPVQGIWLGREKCVTCLSSKRAEHFQSPIPADACFPFIPFPFLSSLLSDCSAVRQAGENRVTLCVREVTVYPCVLCVCERSKKRVSE